MTPSGTPKTTAIASDSRAMLAVRRKRSAMSGPSGRPVRSELPEVALRERDEVLPVLLRDTAVEAEQAAHLGRAPGEITASVPSMIVTTSPGMKRGSSITMRIMPSTSGVSWRKRRIV
jgi:hypothetical protein